MEKEFVININNYILLEFLQMLDYSSYDEDIKEQINKLKLLLNKKIYSDFFKSLNDIEILKEQFILKYLYINID